MFYLKYIYLYTNDTNIFADAFIQSDLQLGNT